jgi:HTH-type transcriptional regulator, transcriptional repressor of NAD biosynthesis genes
MTLPEKPARGFVLGKFMPPHLGHVHLCDFARYMCGRLTILVCSLESDPIPGELRWQWMREMFPECEVAWCSEPLPQEPADHPDFWPIRRDVVHRYAGNPDVVFASETYGARLAAEVGACFVPADRGRRGVPVSGTAIRADPFANWDFIPRTVRPWFVKRVCLFGPESTGKTTLAGALCRRFSTAVASEYARTWSENFGPHVDAKILQQFFLGQIAESAAAARRARRILVEDTDPLLTAVWSEMLLGHSPAWLARWNDYAHLYLLCDIDLPWVDDGSRYFPDASDRKRFFEACHAALEKRGLPYRLIRGVTPDSRERAAVEAVRAVFPGLVPDQGGSALDP